MLRKLDEPRPTADSVVLLFFFSGMATPVAVIPDPKEAPLEAISSSASGSKDGLSTVHLYYSDTELYSNTARVTSVHEVETSSGEKTALVLDETVMHPQGG